MNAEPLNKEIYNKALKLGITKITLNFSGGSDEGCLSVDLTPWEGDYNNKELCSLNSEIENWAWEVYSYSGAGDGNDFGDDIVYDLVNKKVTTSEWFTERQYGDDEEGSLTVAEDEE